MVDINLYQKAYHPVQQELHIRGVQRQRPEQPRVAVRLELREMRRSFAGHLVATVEELGV